jgi:hypothetical protein
MRDVVKRLNVCFRSIGLGTPRYTPPTKHVLDVLSNGMKIIGNGLNNKKSQLKNSPERAHYIL